MGNTALGRTVEHYRHPELMPHGDLPPTFRPDYGFAKQRKQREMIATEEEMKNAKVPKKYRDFCAHKLLDFYKCRHDQFPLVYRCAHEKHTYLTCEYDDYILRMKEFERERRLKVREQRLLRASAA